ncbi:MarR family winged helix-turn-helix transcriptional regulator [uncultured Methanomethylovorans sp.]|uniref:MarR family winged helix-turn-helix transcriptional regulator n=1 Tax=uncultured Methanomethylovorans sp. TaxID=183759 RepID=UPI002AA862D3|nr:MarR family winged helix-turn-helix transcriptional regulator [uncultured Methanomethylovorans sp.]
MAKEYAEQLFLQEKPTLALLAIWSFQKTYASVITKEINSTFAHTTKILSKMEEHGLVKFTMEGRVKYVELTDSGFKVVEALKNLIIALEGELPEGMGQAEDEGNADLSSNIKEVISDQEHDIYEKTKRLNDTIVSIYNELISSGADRETVIMRLGPFKRDLKKIENIIQEYHAIDNATLEYFSDTKDLLESLINQ